VVVDGFAVVVGESFVVTIGFSVDDTIRIEIVLREMLCMFFGSLLSIVDSLFVQVHT